MLYLHIYFFRILLKNKMIFLCEELISWCKTCPGLDVGTLTHVITYEFYEISKNTFVIKHFWTTASGFKNFCN